MFFFLEIFFFVSLDWKAPEWFEATLARLLDTTTRWAFHSLQPHTQRNVPFDLRAIQLSRGNGVFYHHRQPKTLRVPLPLGLQVLGFVLLTRRSFHWSQEIRNVQGKTKRGSFYLLLPTWRSLCTHRVRKCGCSINPLDWFFTFWGSFVSTVRPHAIKIPKLGSKLFPSVQSWKEMLLVHFIKLAACTGGVLFSPFHIECQSCCCGIL